MNRQIALERLRHSKPELQGRFGVIRLALFGSTARDTARSGSDVDEDFTGMSHATKQQE